MKVIFFSVLALFVLSVVSYRIYHLLPLVELKRRARAGDKKDKEIYKVVALDGAVDVLFWLVGASSGIFLVIVASRYAWWLAAALIIFICWLVLLSPRPKEKGWLGVFVALISPGVFKLVNLLHPCLAVLAKLVPEVARFHMHTGLYEKEDLLELLSAQNHQVDSRIPEQELKMAYGALTFGDKKVADVMTPRRDIHFVLSSEVLGPTLMDELHKTGQTRFPVVKEIKKNIEPEVIGTLLFSDIVGLDKEGPVEGAMHAGVHYINDTSGLRACLDAFLKTKAHLLVVVNNFEETVGAISIEDVLGQIWGKPLDIDFTDYHDKKAVAGLHSNKE